ncbi:MAG: M20 family metallopeptidase [Pseudomonadota bacterium]
MSEAGTTATATRAGAIARVRAYLDDGSFERELATRVAHRTESQLLPASLPALHAYLSEEMVPAFEAMGFTCTIFDNPIDGQGPVLLAHRHEDDTAPTVLGYGHGDVVRGQEELWTKGAGPWVTARDGDRLYGRGTADNKAQHTINMAAMRAVMAERGGRLGFNAKVMLEMGEEAGSKGVKALVASHRDAFAADVFIGSDGPRVKADRPTLSLGCRGALNVDLVCDLREGGHHSGNWGGLIANPGVILAHALASIVGPRGELKVDALQPPPMSEAVREVLEDIEIDGGTSGPEVDVWWGEPDLTPPQRVYAGNVFNILSFTTGTPDKPVNAIPPKATANCQLRFIAGTNVDDLIGTLRAHLDAHGFESVDVRPPPAVNDGAFAATQTPPDHPWAQFARGSIQRSSNAKPAVIPATGGSICNDIFTDTLGIPALWVPHSYTACSQHAPDEHILMPVCRSALEVMAGLYWDIGQGDAPAAST